MKQGYILPSGRLNDPLKVHPNKSGIVVIVTTKKRSSKAKFTTNLQASDLCLGFQAFGVVLQVDMINPKSQKYPLVTYYIAIEMAIKIVDLPLKMVDLSMAM